MPPSTRPRSVDHNKPASPLRAKGEQSENYCCVSDIINEGCLRLQWVACSPSRQATTGR
ncbi:hypothetical protein EMIT0P218_80207 [Pseudomonas sp. IT-P218]